MTKKKYDIPNGTPEELIAAFKDAACGRQDYSISDCVWGNHLRHPGQRKNVSGVSSWNSLHVSSDGRN